jgi:hypothetical protein
MYDYPPTPVYVCDDCRPAEVRTIEFLQDRGITDKNAISVLLGNIKQESNFKTTICEGGAITRYVNCRSGGFGLIQWTTAARYVGLSKFCNANGCEVNTLDGQLRYMWNENQFQAQLPNFKTPNLSIEKYMQFAYPWLGWGIHGNRTVYAYDYSRKLRLNYHDDSGRSTTTMDGRQSSIRDTNNPC